MLHAIIMAGGAGTRFWPASRRSCPKQLLDLVGGRTMIQATWDRLGDLVHPERALIVTNQQLVEAISGQLPELPRQAVLGEPCKRDTAPCVGLSAALVDAADSDATMVVMPADHVIQPAEQFRQAVRAAVDVVEANPQRLVTFGIRPTYPAETFGYIERAAAPLSGTGGEGTVIYSVQKFREKPPREVAQEYLEAGNFYWNSGIFVWKAKTILEALDRFEPEMAGNLRTIAAARNSAEFDQVFTREFAAIQGKSIDYAVMEHYDDVAVIEAPFQWDDLGSWRAMARLRGGDDNQNTIVGKYLGLDTRNCIVKGQDDHLIVTLGVENLIVVHTPDATLVANQQDEESIRRIVDLLQEKDWTEFL